MVKDLYKAFKDNGIKGVKDQITADNTKEVIKRNPTPNIEEGLINILNNK